MVFETLTVCKKEAVLLAEISAPRMNLLGPELIRDVVSLVQRAEADNTIRSLEAILSGDDYDADLAERYGWINRALPTAALGEFVASLAHRIAGFPAAAPAVIKERINALALTPDEEFRRDSDRFYEAAKNPETQSRIQAAMKRGFQTRDAENGPGPAPRGPARKTGCLNSKGWLSYLSGWLLKSRRKSRSRDGGFRRVAAEARLRPGPANGCLHAITHCAAT